MRQYCSVIRTKAQRMLVHPHCLFMAVEFLQRVTTFSPCCPIVYVNLQSTSELQKGFLMSVENSKEPAPFKQRPRVARISPSCNVKLIFGLIIKASFPFFGQVCALTLSGKGLTPTEQDDHAFWQTPMCMRAPPQC